MMMDDYNYMRHASQNNRYHHSNHHHHSDYNLDDDLLIVENNFDYHQHNYHDITHDDDDDEDVKIIEPELVEKVKKVVISEHNNQIGESNNNSKLEVKDEESPVIESPQLTKIERPTNLELSPPKYRINKMHMGLKNMSTNVGAAVTPNSKMEFYQETPESFGQVKITQPIGVMVKEQHLSNVIISPTSSQDSDKSHLTDQGFFDLKFFHNKLW